MSSGAVRWGLRTRLTFPRKKCITIRLSQKKYSYCPPFRPLTFPLVPSHTFPLTICLWYLLYCPLAHPHSPYPHFLSNLNSCTTCSPLHHPLFILVITLLFINPYRSCLLVIHPPLHSPALISLLLTCKHSSS